MSSVYWPNSGDADSFHQPTSVPREAYTPSNPDCGDVSERHERAAFSRARPCTGNHEFYACGCGCTCSHIPDHSFDDNSNRNSFSREGGRHTPSLFESDFDSAATHNATTAFADYEDDESPWANFISPIASSLPGETSKMILEDLDDNSMIMEIDGAGSDTMSMLSEYESSFARGSYTTSQILLGSGASFSSNGFLPLTADHPRTWNLDVKRLNPEGYTVPIGRGKRAKNDTNSIHPPHMCSADLHSYSGGYAHFKESDLRFPAGRIEEPDSNGGAHSAGRDTAFASGEAHLSRQSTWDLGEHGGVPTTEGISSEVDQPERYIASSRLEHTRQCVDVTFQGTSTSFSSSTASEGEQSFTLGIQPLPCFGANIVEKLDVLALNAGPEIAQAFLCSESSTIQKPNNSHGPCPQSSRASTATTRRGSSAQFTASTSTTSKSTRDATDDNAEDEQPRKRPRLDLLTHTSSVPTELLACPYAKKDPLRYSERNTSEGPSEKKYRKCSSIYLTSIARLKQHLYRVHRRPEHHCSSCFTPFETDQEVGQHERTRVCFVTDCPFEEKMNRDQVTAIKRKRMHEDKVEAWFAIFKVLFPGSPLPETVYVDCTTTLKGAVSDNSIVARYNAFIEREAPRRLAPLAAQGMFGDDYTVAEVMWVSQVLEQTLPFVLQQVGREFQLSGDVHAEAKDNLRGQVSSRH